MAFNAPTSHLTHISNLFNVLRL